MPQVKQYAMGGFNSTMYWARHYSAKNKVMALLSGFAGVYTEAIMKKRPSRNIDVQNFWLYIFGMVFNAVAMVTQDFDVVMNK
ncbi:CMP-sialic acid transporter 4-like isoform X2 [Quercus lobata]|uniref:CMP-sialic acid transporter 4-like isoform X2 n=1 Tax=Quercus lobata TaxID=97700 RepID=UPI0012459343|nr:CMP-sialic acid transporter 4-like isoform X2 [Quercus lobata]